MPSPVRIDAEVWTDWRFECLAAECGYSVYEAVGRMAKLWSAASEREVKVMPEAAVRTFLGANGPDAIIVAELGDRVDGGIRIRGAHRFEPLWEERRRRRDAARTGGLARVAGANRDERGRVVSETTDVQRRTSDSPASSQPPPSDSPATIQPGTSLSYSGSSSDSEDQKPEGAPVGASSPVRKVKNRTIELEFSSDHARVVDAWDKGFRELHGGAKPDWNKKNTRLLADLRKRHGADEVIRRMEILFAGHGPAWIAPSEADVGSFSAHFDKFASRSQPSLQLVPRQQPNRTPPPRKVPEGELAGERKPA